jgi:uncharacterized membrane protein YgcG
MNPYDPHELDRLDPELDRVALELEEHAAGVRGEPPLDLASRVWAAIENEPLPASRWAWLAGLRRPARGLAAAAVVVAAVTGALAIGSLIDDARPDVGGPSAPEILPSPSETPSPEPTVSPSPTVTPAPSATPSPTDDEVETPEPSESEDDNSGPGGGGDAETPEPSESEDDNSGPGGGDSSGSGSGGGDNSGPGGGG